MIKKLLSTALVLLLSACSTAKVTDYRDNKPELVLEEYFLGRTVAYGIFEDRSGTVKNQFRVTIDGTFKDNILILDENFLYMDGRTEKRLWKITKLADGSYEGYADGVVGTASGRTSGNAFHWTYVFDLPVDDTTYRLRFDDWMFLQQDNVLINRAHVSKWGFSVGSVTIAFHKPETASATVP
jgi:hypothetical protein